MSLEIVLFHPETNPEESQKCLSQLEAMNINIIGLKELTPDTTFHSFLTLADYKQQLHSHSKWISFLLASRGRFSSLMQSLTHLKKIASSPPNL